MPVVNGRYAKKRHRDELATSRGLHYLTHENDRDRAPIHHLASIPRDVGDAVRR